MINKNLTILSGMEYAAYYELPEFNNEQRFKYLTLTEEELQLALSHKSLSAKVYCILQVGYFKAVQLFFQLTWQQIDSDDINLALHDLNQTPITKHEYYTQCTAIAVLFKYSLWSQNAQAMLYAHAATIIRCDIRPQFIALELLSYLQNQKIIRPGYT
jgi:hypothetical protein